MTQTANEALRDGEISHQVNLQRYSNQAVRRFIALLNRASVDLAAQLFIALQALEDAPSATAERLDALLFSVRTINARAYQAAGLELKTELLALTKYEAGFQGQLFRSELPTLVTIAETNAEQVYGAAMSRPFQGRLLSEWASSIESTAMARIRDAVRMGVVENQTTPQIVKRIVGTKTQGYADGIIEIDRRAAESVVRTAVSHVAGFTRQRFHEANSDLIKAISWSSTLDLRTTPGCQIRDGLTYTNAAHPAPIGHSVPWLGGPGALHWCCRSSGVPITKSWKELGIDMADLPAGTRASMDGQVASETSYGQWLAKQSAERQDEVLGPARGKLLREGGIGFDKFFNDKGRFYTLGDLERLDAAAFKKAGL